MTRTADTDAKCVRCMTDLLYHGYEGGQGISQAPRSLQPGDIRVHALVPGARSYARDGEAQGSSM